MIHMILVKCSYHKFSTSEDVPKVQMKTGNKCKNFTKFSPKRGSKNYKKNYANMSFFHHKNIKLNKKPKEISRQILSKY